jgi:thioredoxin reductase (NADPH)
MLDLAIIGGGPAGLTAGLYATRGGMKDVTMFEMGMPGGQITQSSEIENYPGVTGEITGMELMNPWPEQCMQFGLKHDMVEVQRVSQNDDKTFTISLAGGKSVDALSVIIATGSVPKRANFKGEDEFFEKSHVEIEPDIEMNWPETKKDYSKIYPNLVTNFWNQKKINELH